MKGKIFIAICSASLCCYQAQSSGLTPEQIEYFESRLKNIEKEEKASIEQKSKDREKRQEEEERRKEKQRSRQKAEKDKNEADDNQESKNKEFADSISDMITKIKEGVKQSGCPNDFKEKNKKSKFRASEGLNQAIEMAKCYLEQNQDQFEKKEFFIVNDLNADPGSEGRLLLVHISGEIMMEVKSFDGQGGGGTAEQRDTPKSHKTPSGYLCTGVHESTAAVASGVRIKGLQDNNDASDGRGIKLHASNGPTLGCIGVDPSQAEELMHLVKQENPGGSKCGTLILNYSEAEAQGQNNACQAPVN